MTPLPLVALKPSWLGTGGEPPAKRPRAQNSVDALTEAVVESTKAAAVMSWRPPPPKVTTVPADSVAIYVAVKAKAHRTKIMVLVPKVDITVVSEGRGARLVVKPMNDEKFVEDVAPLLGDDDDDDDGDDDNIRFFFQPEFYLPPDRHKDETVKVSLCYLTFTPEEIKNLNAGVRHLVAQQKSLAEKSHLALVVVPDDSTDPDLSVSTTKPTPHRTNPAKPNFMKLPLDALDNSAPTQVIAPRTVA